MTYPNVVSESKTLDRILAGESIARYGDGEFKICRGAGIKSQEGNNELSERMRAILLNSGSCMVGIPNIRSETPKAEFWGKFMSAANLLNPKKEYVSSFITRPDSAPWINTEDYWERLESLWKGQDVTLVRGSSKSLTADDLSSARRVTEIIAPRQHAFADYGAILKRVGTPARAILCLGPSATVMAVDLCKKGVHAIDLGHVGLFWRKHLDGRPMWVSKQEKVAI